MSCSNCYNGCSDIISDRCLKYTGPEIPSLGIETGDPYSQVTQSITSHLVSVLTGEGIVLTIDQDDICEIVGKHLPSCAECDGITLVDIVVAIIKAICEINTGLVSVQNAIATLNADYVIGCLSGVTASSDTHDVLQAAINKICTIETELDALALDVDTNYVKLSEINSLIANYLSSAGTSNKALNKMVPYVAMEYYGPLVNFPSSGDGFTTGVGTGFWEKVYLCNGLNGTPDKRGRVAVGVTDGTMAGGVMSPVVNPGSSPFNPSYSTGSTTGTNSVTLSVPQIPAHSHSATATVSPNPHSHTISNQANSDAGSGKVTVGGDAAEGVNPVTDPVSLSVSVSIGSTGGGQAHANNQPAIGCYYIMYIP